jgi:16S rRNA G966 N2-methylase RsmD
MSAAQESPRGRILFQHEKAIVFHGRWQDLNLPPKSVDVVLTDPPYTEHVHANVRSCSTNGKVKVKKYDIDFDPLAGMDHVPTLLAVARRWVLCFAALEQLGAYEAAAGGPYKAGGSYVRSGIWRKQQAAPQLSGDRPANSCEGWALMHEKPAQGRMTWTGHGKHAYLSSHVEDADRPAYCPDEIDAQIPVDPELLASETIPDFVQCQREKAQKRHPAQKPRALCEQLVNWFVPRPGVGFEGQIVLDAYAGSGALGMAALRAGATVIFCDIDAQWAEFIAGEVRYFLTDQK